MVYEVDFDDNFNFVQTQYQNKNNCNHIFYFSSFVINDHLCCQIQTTIVMQPASDTREFHTISYRVCKPISVQTTSKLTLT